MINDLSGKANKILLVSPPIYDYRLPWSRWHQSTGLLQIATWLQRQNKSVKLIDCLYTSKKQIPRQKIDVQEIEGYSFNKWHYGLSFNAVKTQIENTGDNGWYPDTVFVTTMNSVWWEAARDTIAKLKESLPNSKIILGGTYPSVAPEHAAQNSGADSIFSGEISDARNLPPDISLYANTPNSTGIYFYSSHSVFDTIGTLRPRPVNTILTEITLKAKLGVREFLFFDEEIRYEDRESFSKLLEGIGKGNLDVRFILPGNISPRVMTKRMAQALKQARVKKVYLRCDMLFGPDSIQYTTQLDEYKRCVDLLLENGGFKPRSGDVAAMLVVGLPFEDLDEVSERLIRLAHIVGSVMLVPFQYVPGLHKGILFDRALAQNGSLSPEEFNCNLFRLAKFSGKSLEDYMELTRLAALLNSKYRSKTFDFLGEGLTARMFRESIRTESWNPFPEEETFPEIIPLE